MRRTLDQTFAYRGYFGCTSQCRLRVWEETGQVPVVLFTERDDNKGTSITNRIEHIAWEAYKLLERPAAGMTVIEHYPQRGFLGRRALYEEQFALVSFTTRTESGYRHPAWRHIPKEEVERMVGQILEE